MDKALEFIKKFRERVYTDNSLVAIYNNRTDYTSKIKAIVESITCSKKSEDEGKKNKFYPEYYRIDYTVWKTENPVNKDGVNIYDWDFEYAIEHENDHSDWTYELLKLSFIRAEVRVVIGYMNNTVHKTNQEKEIIQKQVEHFRYSDPNEAIYLVLMNRELEEGEDMFGMRAYCIIDKRVEEIELASNSDR